MSKPIILVLCTGNSCRSHLAEAYLKSVLEEHFQIESAGSNPAGYVHPLATKAMAEIGIDLSKHRSKHLEEFLSQDVETVITVCGKANQHCPDFPGQATRLHLPFDDPADATGSDEEQLGTFRRVRDEIIETLRPFSEERLAKAEAKLKIVSTATSSAAT